MSVKLPNVAVKLDKYQVTAGRVRTMVNRLDGDVRGWIQSHRPSWWKPEWDGMLPRDRHETDMALGYEGGLNGYGDTASYQSIGVTGARVGCYVTGVGVHTWWREPDPSAPGETPRYPQDILDEKVLNCVPWSFAEAFCAWDGGRLPTAAELTVAFHNGSANTAYPWGNAPAPGTLAGGQDRIVHNYGGERTYFYPTNLDVGQTGDQAPYLAAPGRKPLGTGLWADMEGLNLQWVHDAGNNFAWTGSWDGHTLTGNLVLVALQGDATLNSAPGQALEFGGYPNEAYQAMGFRCAR